MGGNAAKSARQLRQQTAAARDPPANEFGSGARRFVVCLNGVAETALPPFVVLYACVWFATLVASAAPSNSRQASACAWDFPGGSSYFNATFDDPLQASAPRWQKHVQILNAAMLAAVTFNIENEMALMSAGPVELSACCVTPKHNSAGIVCKVLNNE